MRVTVPSVEFVTQTAPSPAVAPVGPFPTAITCETWFVWLSMRETVPSSPFATHTAPCVTAIPLGPPPTGIVCRTSFVDGIDAGDRVLAGVRDPDRLHAGRDPARGNADRDLAGDGAAFGIDHADGVRAH